MNGRRIVVTGVNGFVGSSTIEPLSALGYDIHALTRSAEPGAGARGVTYHSCDLLKDDTRTLFQKIRPTALLHLAWIPDRARLWHSADNVRWVGASLAMLSAFQETGGTRVLLAGSSAEYDWSFHTLGEETTPLRPMTLYGRSKKHLFRLASEFAEGTGLSLAWARIFFPFGAADKDDRLLSQVIDGVAGGVPVDCSSGEQVRPFIHVDDVAGALAALVESSVEGPVNIALEETCSVRELTLGAAKLAGDASLVRFGARLAQPGEPPYMRAAVRRLYDEVGYRPKLTIAEGLQRTVAERLAGRRGSGR